MYLISETIQVWEVKRVCAICQQMFLQTEGKSNLILWWSTGIAQNDSDNISWG